MIREVLTYPNPTLRQVSKEVPPERFDSIRMMHLVQDMKETMHHHRGVGLSAVQIGTHWRVVVMQVPPRSEPLVMINPRCDQVNDLFSTEVEEGCLSFPGLYIRVPRRTWVTASWIDQGGLPCMKTFKDLEARCFLHELDHLDGKLLADQPSYPLR